MATLQNVHGGSLVPDFATPLTTGIGQVQGRRREAAAKASLEDLIRGSLGLPQQAQQNLPSGEGLFGQLTRDGGLLGPQRTGTPGVIAEPQAQSTGLLGRLAPGLAQAIGAVRGNPEQEDAIRSEAETGAALASELRGLTDHGARVRRMAEVSGEMVGKGQDIGRVTQLANMSPEQLDLELMKMEMVGKEVATALPQRNRQDAIAELMAENPQLGGAMLARRDREIAAEQARRAAAARAAQAQRKAAADALLPQTELGKGIAEIRADMQNNNITPEVGEQMIANLRGAATAVEAPEVGFDLPDNTMLVDPMNPRAGVTAIPGVTIEPDLNAVEEARVLLGEAGIPLDSPDAIQAINAAAGVEVVPPPAVPAGIQEYNLAKSEGFQGNLVDYQRAKKGGGFSVKTPDGTIVQYGGAGDEPQRGGIDPTSPAAMIASIDGILNDPALDGATGVYSFLQNIPGTEARRIGAKTAQLEGQAFLQAFESLKGAGQITEIEGQKATQAIGRLDSSQKPADYREALQDLRENLIPAMSRPAGWVDQQEATLQGALEAVTPDGLIPSGMIANLAPEYIEQMTPDDVARLNTEELQAQGLTPQQWDAIIRVAERGN